MSEPIPRGGAVPALCADNATYLDKHGFPCGEWGPAAGFPCDEATAGGKYDDEDEVALLHNCRASCGLCSPQEAGATAAPTAAPVLNVTATTGPATTTPGPTGPCVDEPDFVDTEGFTCTDWSPELGFSCDKAVDEGYTVDEQAAIMKACPKSCGLCQGGAKKPPMAAQSAAPVVDVTTTTTTTTTAKPANCDDSSTFRDSEGFACNEWGPDAGYACSAATEQGYSAEEQAVIMHKCRKSCQLCDNALPSVRHATVEPATTTTTTTAHHVQVTMLVLRATVSNFVFKELQAKPGTLGKVERSLREAIGTAAGIEEVGIDLKLAGVKVEDSEPEASTLAVTGRFDGSEQTLQAARTMKHRELLDAILSIEGVRALRADTDADCDVLTLTVDREVQEDVGATTTTTTTTTKRVLPPPPLCGAAEEPAEFEPYARCLLEDAASPGGWAVASWQAVWTKAPAPLAPAAVSCMADSCCDEFAQVLLDCCGVDLADKGGLKCGVPAQGASYASVRPGLLHEQALLARRTLRAGRNATAGANATKGDPSKCAFHNIVLNCPV